MKKEKLKIFIVLSGITYFMLSFGEKVYGAEISINDKINSEIENFIKDQKVKNSPDFIFELKAVQKKNNTNQLTGVTNQPALYLFLKNTLKEKSYKIDEDVRILPNPELKDRIYGLVSLSVANMRTNPRHPAELATQALLGTPLNILDKSGGWLLVQTPDNYTAWTEESGVTLMNKAEINRWIKARKLVYYKFSGNAYETSSTRSQTVSDLVICDVVEYIGETEHFYKTIYPDKRIAYILKSECIEFKKWSNMKNPTPAEIIQTAKKLMGIPYLWGGTSSKGVDCSGFTKLTFMIRGIILQRDASQQANYGKAVEQENILSHLRPANLLFFGEKKSDKNKERITHVALYIGNGQFIHSSGRVCINSFDPASKIFSEGRKNSLVKAADYVGSIGSANITKIKNNNYYRLR